VGAECPSVNLGPPHILETTIARKLKFYTPLDSAKYILFSGMKIFLLGACGVAAPPGVS